MRQIVYENDFIKGFLCQRDNDFYYIHIAEHCRRLRKSLNTKDYLQALRKCFAIIDDYNKGIINTPTFESVCKEFLKTIEKDKKKQDYEKRLKQVFYQPFGKVKINDLTEKSINDFMIKRLNEVKPQTINRDISTLLQVLKFAKRKSYIDLPPSIERLKEDKKKRDAFTDLELSEIMTTAQQRIEEASNRKIRYDRTMLCLFLKFLVETGIRTGEASSIKFSGISADTAKITSSKTKIRDIFLSNNAQHIIKELKETYNQYNIKFNNDDFIFLNYQGKPTKSFKKSFNELLKKTTMANTIGKNELTLYSFRHTFITNAIKKNIPLTTIAIQCGTSIEMIEKNYNHLAIHLVKDDLK